MQRIQLTGVASFIICYTFTMIMVCSALWSAVRSNDSLTAPHYATPLKQAKSLNFSL